MRALRQLNSERGFVLVMALGILVVLSIVGTTVLMYTTSSSRSASSSQSNQVAYALAEGGVNDAASVLVANPKPDVWAGHPTQASPSTITYPNGTVAWWATSVNCSPKTCWRLTAQSTVRNPTGPTAAPVHRTVSFVMRVAKSHTTGSFAGTYIYADGDVKIDGSAIIEEPVIAGGNLDMSSTKVSNVLMSVGSLVSVSGQVQVNNGWVGNGPTTTLTGAISASSSTIPVTDASGFASIGTLKIDDEWMKYSSHTGTSFTIDSTCGAGASLCRGYGGFSASPAASHSSGTLVDGRLTAVHAAQGCAPTACASNTRIYSASPPDATPISFTKPTADEQQMFANAAPGPKSVNTCSGTSPTGSFATFFDNQSTASATLNHSISTAINLTGSTYDCTGTAPDGTTGEIKWDGTTLTVHGTVFLDGDITVGSNLIYSTGSAGATIWTSGNFTLNKAMCASGTTPNCNFSTWDPSANDLGIVAHTFAGSTNGHCASFSSGGKFQGLIYADSGCGTSYAVEVRTGSSLQGLVIANSVHLSGSAGNPSPAIAFLPAGFPGEDKYEVTYEDGSYGG